MMQDLSMQISFSTLFLVSHVVFKAADTTNKEQAEVIDLEESLNALHNETGVTLSLIVLRKQRRKKIILALIVIGVVLFLLLLATYLGRT